jgi:hypothetical protein
MKTNLKATGPIPAHGHNLWDTTAHSVPLAERPWPAHLENNAA